MSNLSLRILTGTIYVAIMVASAVLGNPYLAILMGIVCFFATNELATISGKTNVQYIFTLPFLLGGLIAYLNLTDSQTITAWHFTIAFIAQLVCIGTVYYFLKKSSIVQYVAAVFYVWLPLACLAFWYTQNLENSVNYLLFFFIAIWTYDSMAYTVGRLLGKKPIFPKVSPKKTIEGAVGGAIITVFIMFLLNKLWLQLPLNVWIASVTIVFFGTFGDFVESYLKRKIGVKDSGTIIPGHGGILDRIDSILLAVLPYILIIILF